MRLLDDRLSGLELIVLVVLALTVLAPFSCWPPERDQRLALRLWFFGQPHDTRLLQRAVRAFERQRPDLRVVVESFPGNTYLQKLLPAMQAGAAGDVVYLHWAMVGEVASKGALLALEQRAHADSYDLADLFPGSTEPYTLDGHLYAIPFRGSTMVLFYNRDLFEAAGVACPTDDWTREDFLDAARRLTIIEDGRPKQIGCVPDEPTSWIYSAGGRYGSDDLSELSFTDPRTLDGLRFYIDLRNRHGVAPRNMGSGGDDPTGVDVFEGGRVAMLVSGPWELGSFAHIRAFRWGVALFPKGPAGRRTRYAGTGFGIWSGTRHADAAWALVRFLCGHEAGKMLCDLPTDVPARRRLAYTPDFLKPQYPWDMAAFLRAMEPDHATLRTFPRSTRWAEVRRRFNRSLDEVLIEGRDLEQAMGTLQQEVRRYLDGSTR